MSIAERLENVRSCIADSCESSGRSIDGVTLIAVSKRHGSAAIQEAYEAGHRDFGESYPQEMIEKSTQLANACPEIRWHFVGRVQRNKAALISEAGLIHGIGSMNQIRAIARRIEPTDRAEVLLQVNQGAEAQKNGFSPDGLVGEIAQMSAVKEITIRGLMTLPPHGETENSRAYFRKLRLLRDNLVRELGVDLPFLSMGMTRDYADAVLEGATHIRVGTAIFGPRPV
jgi:PLP dependent protein